MQSTAAGPARKTRAWWSRSLSLPVAAWGAFLPLGALAFSLGGGAYVTVLMAIVPFSAAGLLLGRIRGAVALTLVIGLAHLMPFSEALRGFGLKPGTLVGAAVVGALALALGNGLAAYVRCKAMEPRHAGLLGPAPRGAQPLDLPPE